MTIDVFVGLANLAEKTAGRFNTAKFEPPTFEQMAADALRAELEAETNGGI